MLADANEAGVLDPGRFDPGAHQVDFLFDVHPPLEFDEDVGHLNLLLAYEHREYREVEIVLADADYIQESIVDPGAVVVDGFANIMPSGFGDSLYESEITDIVAYLSTLK